MKKQKVLAMLLGLCLAVTQLPMSVLAADFTDQSGLFESEAIAVSDIAIERDLDDSIEAELTENSEELLVFEEDESEAVVSEEELEITEEDAVPEELPGSEAPKAEKKAAAEDELKDESAVTISNASDLAAVRDNLTGNYVLAADIDLTNYTEWTPIGLSDSEAFTGVFDGAGHKITIGTVSGSSYSYFGFFGVVKNATIKNLDVEATITGSQISGVLAGYTDNVTVEACSTTGSVIGTGDVGGIIGYAKNTLVKNCYSTAIVTGSSSAEGDGVGGLIGEMYGANSGTTKVVCCYALGEIRKQATTNGKGGITGRRATYYGNTVIQFSFYGENGASDKENGFAVSNDTLKKRETFVGWDFTNIWAMDSSHNNGYPYLKRNGEYWTFELSGTGAADNPYIVTSEEELAAIARGEIGTDTFSYCYKLANDITLTGTYWTPIGGNNMPAMTGTFDGAGHKISGLNIGAIGYPNQGLFGVFSGTVKNLDVTNASIKDAKIAGVLAGTLENAAVEACSTSGSVIGTGDVGGLAGYASNTTVRNSYSIANVTANSGDGDVGVGGLIGELYGHNSFTSKISMSYAAGTVVKNGTTSGMGGLVGRRTTYYGSTNIIDSYYSARTKQSDRENGFSLSVKKLQAQSTFVYWDFDNVWQCNASENNGYPTLKRAKEYQPIKLSGQGTSIAPFIIKNEKELAAVARGEVGAENYRAYYKLANDITITSEYWTPIGGNGADGFDGYFDGQGHTISGLTIIFRGYSEEGLFGSGSGKISNLILDNVKITEARNAGAIYGSAGDGTTINTCASYGSIEGFGDLGGLTGYLSNGSIFNSYSRLNITSTSADEGNGVGGLVGEIYGHNGGLAKIKDSYAAGKLSKSKNNNGIGGLAGRRPTYYGETMIYDSFYDTAVTGLGETTSGFGILTAIMKNAKTYTYWDFTNVWAIDGSTNDGYPYLKFAGEYTPVLPEGSGVELDPYYITNEFELAALAKGELDFEGYYVLDKDVVITSDYWTPIGGNGEAVFSGVFDGDGHTISGLTELALGYGVEGLFGSVSGTIKNLRVSGNIRNARSAGILAYELLENASIIGCATLGSLTGEGHTAGLVAYINNANVKDCYSRVSVTNTSTDTGYGAGGLIANIYGHNSGKSTVENCYATGVVERSAASTGGLIGIASTYYGSNVVTSCYYDNLNDGSTDKGTYTVTDNMKLQSTYVDWDFSKTWSIASTENDGYPQLQIFAGSEIPGPSDVKVTGVSLNKSSLTLTIGENETLTATVLPVTATNKNITWSTSDAKIANVDTTGKVTAVAKGTATITVTTEDGNKTATCAVTVGDGTVETTGVTLNKKTLSLETGKTEALTVSFTPKDATDKEVTFASGNTSVATVSDAGVVTAVAAGTTTITVSLKSNPTIADTCEVTVTPTVIKTTGVTLNKKTLSLEKGKTEALTVSFTPADATDKTVTFASDNTAVATVSADGTVTAVAKGTANITVTLNSDSTVSDTCVVTVTESEDPGPGPGPGPGPDPEPTEVTYQVRFYVDGYESGELKKVTIAAGDTLYEAMPETSEVLELIPDGATFLGWYIDGTNTLWDITAPVNRNLDLEARYISPDADEGHEDPGSGRDPGMIQEEGSGEEIGVAYYYDVYMVSGQSYTFPVNYSELDGGTGTGKITWKTSDKTFIKITSKYKAKALKATGATDEVFVFDGNSVTDSVFVYAIHIVAPSITQNGAAVPKSQTLLKGETVNLEVAGFGEYEDYFDISWNTSNAEIARVDDGIVTATGKGTAKISAFVNGKAFTCSVKVVDSQKPDKITAKTSIKLAPLQAATLKFSVSGLKAKGLEWQDESGNALTAYTKDGAKASTGDKISYYQNDVVRLTPTGKVTAVGTGDCVVIAKDNKNGGSAQVTVKVPEQAANVIYLNKGKTKNIKYYNVKSSAKSTTYTLGSADERNIVALNDTKGSVKGLNAGKATVTCTADPYGTGKGIKYSTIVFVENPTLDISSNKWSKPNKTQTSATLTLTKGEKFVIKVNDTYQPIIFTSNKDSVAFVDEAGVVSARNAGKATLTARVNGMKVTVKVVVGN